MYASQKSICLHIPIRGDINVAFVVQGKYFEIIFFLQKSQKSLNSYKLEFRRFYCSYKTKRLLNSHHIRHTEFQHKCHKCKQCEKSFRKKASLRIHMESNTGLIIKPIKPFVSVRESYSQKCRFSGLFESISLSFFSKRRVTFD